MSVRINAQPVAQGYAARGEKIIEYSSPSGGGLISFREVDGRVLVDLYRHDDTVDVRVGAPNGMPPEPPMPERR